MTVATEDLYARQMVMADAKIAELESQTAEDADDLEDIQAALADLGAFHAHLSARRAFVTGIAIQIDPTTMLSLTSNPLVQSLIPLRTGADLASDGADALATAQVDRATVLEAARQADGSGLFTASGPDAAAFTEVREPTCDQRGEEGRVPRRYLDPNPVYFAPSRHLADTVLGDADGGGRLKVHRLRFRWRAEFGLAWMCADKPGDRNVEMEAMVYPEDPRWSDNWGSNSARRYTQTNMPGNIHQDDLAAGDGRVFEKARYPDFAIVAQSSRAFRYRKLYFVDFTTNEGDTAQGRVIYSAQPTHRARTDFQKGYCGLRGGDYKSCMFSQLDVCYAHRYISERQDYTRIDWAASLGYSTSMSRVAQLHPEYVENGSREVTRLCDPRPPGSGRN